ncbi:hypothetical protein QYE76_029987 [Lolium multiflorum]|uniref:Transposase (putative) gypsy type domain-containing protein n=1 Tax=Lolium multiflorum TaxID=4521 RepID=A0AAD8QS97_LOLMU|nr:hypothetical protein QYE76_029987 [Lolium multiflorum]
MALVERGFSLPPSDFFSEILKAYELQPHHISPNSILAISNHVTLCEGHLRVTPELSLFQMFRSGFPRVCGLQRWPAGETRPGLNVLICRVSSVDSGEGGSGDDEGLSGKDLTMSWFTKRIQPLQHRDRLMFQYTGRDDLMRASKDNLSANALDKRIRVMLKVMRDLRIHVGNIDIHTNGSGTAALEEKDLGTLTLVPHAGNTDPEVASDVEAPKALAPTKRKRGASSGPAAKRAREVPSTAATRKAEAEKKRLKLIDTSKQSQPNIEQFFLSSGKSSLSKPPKNPKKKAKPSPASMPITPQVEAPPKPSSSASPISKDAINLDDLPEDPTAESGKGGSGKCESSKDASSSHPPPEQPDITSAEATAHDAEQKLPLSGATGTPQTHPHLFSILHKVPISQRHAEMSHLVNEVWGNPEAHSKLHEDLRVHVLEQKAEVEGLRQSYADSQKVLSILETKNYEEIAKRPSIDALSAQLKVLEAEHESLKNFLKEPSEEETKKKKELAEKQAQDMADLDDKLKKRQQRQDLGGKE